MLVSILHYQIKKYWDDKFRIMNYLFRIIFSVGTLKFFRSTANIYHIQNK